MEVRYFKSAWGDIRHSPGWFGKLCLLALLGCVPVFGQIVISAYLYGWAREIAWKKHQPMPARVFANDDGKFWRRGWFTFVLTAVLTAVPIIVMGLGKYCQGFGYSYSFFSAPKVVNPLLVGFGGLLAFVGWLAVVAVVVFVWVGNMRVSIYDRLSAGFQFGKVWKMLRHDAKGILKIFAMGLLFEAILSLVLSIITIALAVVVMDAGIAALSKAGYYVDANTIQYMSSSQLWYLVAQVCSASGIFLIIAMVVWMFCLSLFNSFVQMLVVRAVGYWTMQFDVPQWTGQDNPMPFELLESQ